MNFKNMSFFFGETFLKKYHAASTGTSTNISVCCSRKSNVVDDYLGFQVLLLLLLDLHHVEFDTIFVIAGFER